MNYSISTNDSLYSKSNNSQIISYSLSQFQNGGIKNINQNQNNINKNNNQNKSNKKINNKKGFKEPSHTPILTADSIFKKGNNISKKKVINKYFNYSSSPKKIKKIEPQIFESEISLDENNVISTFDNNDNLNKISKITDKSKFNILKNNSINDLNEDKKNINNNRINVNNLKLDNQNDNEKNNLNSLNQTNDDLNKDISKDNIIKNNQIFNKMIKENFNVKIDVNEFYKKYNTIEDKNPYINNYKFYKNYNINGKRISLIDNLEIFNSQRNISRTLSFKKNLNYPKIIDKKINEEKIENKLPKLNKSLTPKLKELIPNGHHINKNNKLLNQDNNISIRKEFYKITLKNQQNKPKNYFKGHFYSNKNKKKNLNQEIVLDNSLNEIDFKTKKYNNLEISNSLPKSEKYNLNIKINKNNINDNQLNLYKKFKKETFKKQNGNEIKYNSEEIKMNGMYISYSDSDISKTEELNKNKLDMIKNNSSGNLINHVKDFNMIKLSIMNEKAIKREIEEKKKKEEEEKIKREIEEEKRKLLEDEKKILEEKEKKEFEEEKKKLKEEKKKIEDERKKIEQERKK